MKLLWCLLFPLSLFAQQNSIAEKTKGMKYYEGFIPFYLDEQNGKVFWVISQLNQEFLYVNSLSAGVGSNDIGLDRGQLGQTKVVFFEKVGKKIFLIQPNYDYRAITNDAAEKRAVRESFAQSTIAAFTIEASNEKEMLIDATDFLLRDAHGIANRLRGMRQGNYSLDKNRSAFYQERTKNFPLNTEIETTITFVNTDGVTGEYINSVTPSSDAVTVRMHHSFVQLPDDQYQPRAYDPRSSFIPFSYYDYASPVSTPIEKHFIIRHRLNKKDPSAKISEAVKPIIYYLDNGTPEPVRSALLEGAQWWNQAFEAAGYKNAFQVKILPEDADPMDIRYNMINWVHRSTRGWSYGASVVDPRTGEILKGNVSLGSLRVRQDYLIATGLLSPFENGEALPPSNDPMLQMALQRLKQLSAHEVGHTLGLMHNYSASYNENASVMDYPHPIVTLQNQKIDLSKAYSNGIGAWDKVSIAYGYQDFPKGVNEKTALNQILSSAQEQGLQFITDKDARAAGGLHPTAHLWDNGKTASEELNRVLQIRQSALQQFGEKAIRKGEAFSFLEDVLVPIYFFHRYQVEATVKVVGGMYYTYATRGSGLTVTAPIEKKEQVKAVDALLQSIHPKTLVIPETILSVLPPRAAGYSTSRELFKKRTGLAFDPMAAAETATDLVFSLLFHPERLNRMSSYQQTNTFTLMEFLEKVIRAVWMAEKMNGAHGAIQQQNQQILLNYLLAASIEDQNNYAVKAAMLYHINQLKSYLENALQQATDVQQKAHIEFALSRMKSADKIKITTHPAPPPGAPIGCDIAF